MPVIPPEDLGRSISQPIVPSLKLGAVSGIGGFLLGGGIGTLRSAHPGLVATFTGAQFFVLGSSFLYTREIVMHTAFSESSRRADLISSTTAGVVSGAAAGAFYGRVNSVAGAIVFGALGHVGQRYAYRLADTETPQNPKPLLDRVADSKWIPFRSISNSDYERMLMEKLLKVEAEISLIDDKIAVLRETKHDMSADRKSIEKL